ncbi:helix-turn-helix domain-containing protein [Anaerotignum sp.]
MSEFAENLKKYRKQKNYTQVELAEKLNYGYTAVGNYESGRNEPSFDDLISLSYALDVTPNDLLGFSAMEEDNKLLFSFKSLQPKHQKIILDMIDALQP